MSSAPILTDYQSQRASSDLMLIMITLLLSALFTRASQHLHLNSLLMQNQVAALRASREARNRALEATPTSPLPLSCSEGSARSGKISRSFYRCDYFPFAEPSAIPLIEYDLLFREALSCPARSVPHAAPLGWTRRSFYECTTLPSPTLPSMIVRGDLNLESPLKMPVAPESLIGARGSLALSALIIEADTTIVSLGDITISSIISRSKAPLNVYVLAPLGLARIRAVQGAVIITVRALDDQVPPSVPRGSLSVPPPLRLLDNLTLGLFSSPLA